MNNTISITEFHGKAKETGREYSCFKLTIGDWEHLIFPKTNFEYKYIKSILDSK